MLFLKGIHNEFFDSIFSDKIEEITKVRMRDFKKDINDVFSDLDINTVKTIIIHSNSIGNQVLFDFIRNEEKILLFLKDVLLEFNIFISAFPHLYIKFYKIETDVLRRYFLSDVFVKDNDIKLKSLHKYHVAGIFLYNQKYSYIAKLHNVNDTHTQVLIALILLKIISNKNFKNDFNFKTFKQELSKYIENFLIMVTHTNKLFVIGGTYEQSQYKNVICPTFNKLIDCTFSKIKLDYFINSIIIDNLCYCNDINFLSSSQKTINLTFGTYSFANELIRWYDKYNDDCITKTKMKEALSSLNTINELDKLKLGEIAELNKNVESYQNLSSINNALLTYFRSF